MMSFNINVYKKLSLLWTLGLFITGCVLQPPANTQLPSMPQSQWFNKAKGVSESSELAVSLNATSDNLWWKWLDDQAINVLIDAAEKTSPTVGLAIARVDEARASLNGVSATNGPQITANNTSKREQNVFPLGALQTNRQTTSNVNLNFSWELDLFGRQRHNLAASKHRLTALESDAEFTRITLQSQVAEGVVNTRACSTKLEKLNEDLVSRQQTLKLTQLRLSVGQVSPSEVARARSSASDSANSFVTTGTQCTKYITSLVTLTGWSAGSIQNLLASHVLSSSHKFVTPPPSLIALPATILAKHPDVITALHDADAAYEDIGSAEAARFPTLDLGAALGGNFLRAASINSNAKSWSLSSTIDGIVWDGGNGRFNVDSASARYKQALAKLDSALRTASEEIENSIGQLDKAEAVEVNTIEKVKSAEALLKADKARLEFGKINMFEFEDTNRVYISSVTSFIDAKRDRALAWIALVKSTGNAIEFIY